MRCRLGLFSDITKSQLLSAKKNILCGKKKKKKKKKLGGWRVSLLFYLKHNLMRGKKTGHPLKTFVHTYSSIDFLAF